jgi:tryptophan 2,3-dioxygenase
MDILAQPNIQDSSPDLFVANHRLKRVVTIFQVLVDKINILETMTPLDFLDFRNMLRPASGFQSVQFKLLEAFLGLKMEQRHGKQYYVSQLRPADVDVLRQAEGKKTLIELVNNWLERMPFFDNDLLWENNEKGAGEFWKKYDALYRESLVEAEAFNLGRFEALLLSEEKQAEWSLSSRARRAALFIMLYRDYPLLQLPFQLINVLLEIDESMATWRYRHMNMVHRMIGTRTGTGGSSGKDYLRGALERHYIFSEFAELNSFMIERNRLPVLPSALKKHLGFNG